MFGLSVFKLFLLVALLLAVWYAFKFAGRLQEMRQVLRRAQQAAARAQARSDGGTAKIGAEDLVKCRVCGAYVAARGAARCGRADCPV